MRREIAIDDAIIGENKKAYIIAEIGLNHNNDMELTKKMIRNAKENGADAVKFQTFISEKLFMDSIEIFPLFKSLELTKEDFKEISSYCKKTDITFFSTPFCTECVEWLEEIDVPCYKIASSDLDFIELIVRCANTKKPVILSTGMGDLPSIKKSVKIIEKTGNKNIIILHTITKYPPEYKDMDLRMISRLRKEFDYPIGFSDHSLDNTMAVVARALGASIFEKHFTLDKKLPGPDHAISLEPKELMDLKKKLSAVDAGLEEHLNERSDALMAKGAKRSLYASKDIHSGTIISREMINIIRPRSVLTPLDLNKLLGKRLKKDLKKNDPFDFTCV